MSDKVCSNLYLLDVLSHKQPPLSTHGHLPGLLGVAAHTLRHVIPGSGMVSPEQARAGSKVFVEGVCVLFDVGSIANRREERSRKGDTTRLLLRKGNQDPFVLNEFSLVC
eukprot:scaffold54601_cov21-Tisochrysis_lutea.AAC.3